MNNTQNHTTDENSAAAQARAQLNSVLEMVTALDCDYDRLEELAAEHAELLDAVDEATTAHKAAGEELEASADCVRYHHTGELDPNGGYLEHEQYRADYEHHALTHQELTEAQLNLESWERDNGEELAELTAACNECRDQDDAQQRIYDDALSVEVRSDWHEPGADSEPSEYRIVLCTGGPHCEIVGDLNQYGEPETAQLYYSDWGTGKQEYITTDDEQAALVTYASQFLTGN